MWPELTRYSSHLSIHQGPCKHGLELPPSAEILCIFFPEVATKPRVVLYYLFTSGPMYTGLRFSCSMLSLHTFYKQLQTAQEEKKISIASLQRLNVNIENVPHFLESCFENAYYWFFFLILSTLEKQQACRASVSLRRVTIYLFPALECKFFHCVRAHDGQWSLLDKDLMLSIFQSTDLQFQKLRKK